MYEYITGKLAIITPTSLVVEAGGVGYRVHISLNTFKNLQKKESVKVYIHQVVKEDSNEMYGFSEKLERRLFLLLISVSGVGATTAQIMLSSMGTKDIEYAIVSEDVTTLKSIKGIGEKTAQRIIIDLKGKVKMSEEIISEQASLASVSSQIREEAVSALQMLGFKKSIVEKAVNKVAKSEPDALVEDIIKLALKQL